METGDHDDRIDSDQIYLDKDQQSHDEVSVAPSFDGNYPITHAMLLEERRIRWRNVKERRRAKKDRLNNYWKLKFRFFRRLGYIPDFRNPQTFNEKINWRKINQHDDRFRRITDKYLVRAYVAEQLGEKTALELFPPLLAVTSSPEKLRFSALPRNLVLKCAHASGWNILIRESIPIDHALAVKELREWLSQSYKPYTHQWSYIGLKRQIVIEEMLMFTNGESAYDMKLHCFDGKCRMLESHTGHFETRRRHHLGVDFLPIPGIAAGPEPLPARPDYFKELLAVAERLASAFDYIRVDFLTTDHDFHLNELTVYPSSGMRRYEPDGADMILGSFWSLEKRD